MTRSTRHGRRVSSSLVRSHAFHNIPSAPSSRLRPCMQQLTQTPCYPRLPPPPELSLFCLLLINILQAAVAIRSPPAPYPPLPSPAKSTSTSPAPRSKQGQHRTATTTTPVWRSGKSGVLSPNVRVPPSPLLPKKQRTFMLTRSHPLFFVRMRTKKKN